MPPPLTAEVASLGNISGLLTKQPPNPSVCTSANPAWGHFSAKDETTFVYPICMKSWCRCKEHGLTCRQRHRQAPPQVGAHPPSKATWGMKRSVIQNMVIPQCGLSMKWSIWEGFLNLLKAPKQAVQAIRNGKLWEVLYQEVLKWRMSSLEIQVVLKILIKEDWCQMKDSCQILFAMTWQFLFSVQVSSQLTLSWVAEHHSYSQLSTLPQPVFPYDQAPTYLRGSWSLARWTVSIHSYLGLGRDCVMMLWTYKSIVMGECGVGVKGMSPIQWVWDLAD